MKIQVKVGMRWRLPTFSFYPSTEVLFCAQYPKINCSSAGATHNREPLRGASQARAVHATRAYINRGLRSVHSLTPGCNLSPFQGCTASYKFTAVSESCKLAPFWGCTSPYGFSNDERPLKTLSLLSRSPFCLYCLSHPLPFMPPFSKLPQLPIKCQSKTYKEKRNRARLRPPGGRIPSRNWIQRTDLPVKRKYFSSLFSQKYAYLSDLFDV